MAGTPGTPGQGRGRGLGLGRGREHPARQIIAVGAMPGGEVVVDNSSGYGSSGNIQLTNGGVGRIRERLEIFFEKKTLSI